MNRQRWTNALKLARTISMLEMIAKAERAVRSAIRRCGMATTPVCPRYLGVTRHRWYAK
jgi:hypothetical protein